MKISRRLDRLDKELKIIEKKGKKAKSEQTDEIELLVKFDSYKPLKYERLKKHGQIVWDHALDGYELLPDEFEFYLSRHLYETTPEQRYQEAKEHWYFHENSAFLDMEKGKIDTYGCKPESCVPECKYYKKGGMIDDDQVINEWRRNTTIVDLDQYRKELGEELYEKIMNYDDDDENGYDRQKMRQECVEYYSKIDNRKDRSKVTLVDENTITRMQY